MLNRKLTKKSPRFRNFVPFVACCSRAMFCTEPFGWVTGFNVHALQWPEFVAVQVTNALFVSGASEK